MGGCADNTIFDEVETSFAHFLEKKIWEDLERLLLAKLRLRLVIGCSGGVPASPYRRCSSCTDSDTCHCRTVAAAPHPTGGRLNINRTVAAAPHPTGGRLNINRTVAAAPHPTGGKLKH